jgi:hypothetical protein
MSENQVRENGGHPSFQYRAAASVAEKQRQIVSDYRETLTQVNFQCSNINNH